MKIRQKTHAHITYPIKYHFRRSVVNNPVQLHPLVPGMCPRYRKPFLPLTYFDQELRKPGNSFFGCAYRILSSVSSKRAGSAWDQVQKSQEKHRNPTGARV